MRTIQFILNGKQVTADVAPNVRLIDLLRDTFKLTGTKEACGQGECGACTILLDNEAVHACLLLAPRRTVGAEDVGDLQAGPPHGGTTRSSASPAD